MKLKKYIIYLLPLALTACNYLDFNESNGKEKEYYYAYFNETLKLVTNVYSYLPTEFDAVDGALRESATDNGVYVWKDCNVVKFYNGMWSPISTVDDKGAYYYSGIRAANSFLENFNIANYDKFKNNETYTKDLNRVKLYPYEVRFLRAFYYFELVKRYGNTPLLTRTYNLDEINSVKPVSFDSIVSFIQTECDTVAKYLPTTHANFGFNETGRITKGACYALKSRALLYAASELNNPGNADPSKWEKAALAAKQLLDMNIYAFDAATFDMYSNANASLASKQLILEARDGAQTNTFEAKNFPMGVEGGKTGNCPSQNLVDAFEFKTGVKFDWNNPAHVANPYTNRDPRLAKTVMMNTTVMRAGDTIQTFTGGKHGAPINGATQTGYYLRKYVNVTCTFNATSPVKKTHNWILFRYAEILLNYAEALNEWKGPDYKDATFTMSAKEAVNKVRTQATMPLFTETTQEDFRTHLRNERRVELAFEDHRFWDLRRWKTAPESTIYGITITPNKLPRPTAYTYARSVVEVREWDDKMFRYPIPQAEIFKNPNLTQNLGW